MKLYEVTSEDICSSLHSLFLCSGVGLSRDFHPVMAEELKNLTWPNEYQNYIKWNLKWKKLKGESFVASVENRDEKDPYWRRWSFKLKKTIKEKKRLIFQEEAEILTLEVTFEYWLRVGDKKGKKQAEYSLELWKDRGVTSLRNLWEAVQNSIIYKT